MDNTSSAERAPTPSRSWSLDRLFDAAKKDTVIRLRWPLVILSSYLLYYTPSHWLTPTQVQAILILYLLSHTTLYFLADELFDSPYVYGPLLVFDTLVLAVVLEMGGSATPDFYVACLFTLVLSCICNDARGLLVVTLLAPLIYGYFVFNAAADFDPNLYLRLPFPFVISLFYGYFAQVERLRRSAREKEEQVWREQKAAEEIRRQRERLEVMHEINLSLTSTIDSAKILEAFLDRALIHLPYAAAIVRLKNHDTGVLQTAAARGVEIKRLNESKAPLDFIDRVVTERTPLTVGNAFADPEVANLDLFKEEGLVAFLALPLIANSEALGALVFLTREAHQFGADEVDFLSTLAGQAAIAIHHSQLYDRSQQQGAELRHAHHIKDDFLKAVTTELKTPLNVITGYTDMFRDGLLGAMTPIQEKALESVARQSKDLHRLINSVLQVSTMEAETLRIELQDINLWEFLSELRSQYDHPLGKNVKFIWDYPVDFPTLQGDRGKLKRILENLINNAIKFTDHGTIAVAAKYLAAKKMLQFTIADTGVGIPEEQIAAVFERFRQVQGADAKMQRGGMGLGLYVVKKYIDLLGGTVHAESRAGQGSTFTLQVPAPLAPLSTGHEQLLLLKERDGVAASSNSNVLADEFRISSTRRF
ncbi:MAG: histidine kinase, partial [Deltaproteobacteria bacterium]|nr:histidine kinase [Deltaproteobacteria bacterium]